MRRILLIVSPQFTGLQYHRQIMPHQYLIDTFSDFLVEQAILNPDGLHELTDEKIQQYEAISFLRHISLKGETKNIIDRIHSLGVKVFFDIDDYWHLPSTHAMFLQYKHFKIPQQTEDALRHSDLVTTTTPFIRNYINKINPNVFVLPNCIDERQEQFKPRKIDNGRVRFGGIWGVFHYEDVKMIANNFTLLDNDKELKGKWQICLGGYTKGEDEYKKIESVMTNDNRMVKFDKDYSDYLKQETQSMEHVTFDKPYRRLYGRDVNTYGELYNEIDVALIPLVDDRFNNCKSQLKIIEAGIMGKAIIVSEIPPYILDNRADVIYVKDNRAGWYNAMKALIKNPEIIKQLGESLKSYVRENYSIDKITEQRCQIYKHYLS